MMAEQDFKRLDKLLGRLSRTLALFFVILMGLGVWSIVLQNETANLGRENKHRIAEIKGSRLNSILASCEESNARNAKLKGILGIGDSQIAKEVRSKRAEQHERGLLAAPLAALFVEAIAIMHPDCLAYAKERTSRSGGKH